MGEGYLCANGLGVELIDAARREGKISGTRQSAAVLDATTDSTELRSACAAVYRGIVRDSTKQLARTSAVAYTLGLNAGAGACGIFPFGNVTNFHQHFLGVLNIADGTKRWLVRAPCAPTSETREIMQNDGDILWLPPGWHHKVMTVGVARPGTGQLAGGFATWALPRAMSADALLNYLRGRVVEGQQMRQPKHLCTKGLVNEALHELHATLRDSEH